MNKISLFWIVVTLIISYFIFHKDTYHGVFYPDASNLYRYERSAPFDSKDKCIQWVNKKVVEYGITTRTYDYECGKNCLGGKDGHDLDLAICDE